MLSRVILAVVVGIVTFLIASFVGSLLVDVPISWVAKTGKFLEIYATLLGLAAALWYGFSGFRRT